MTWDQAERWIANGWATLVERTATSVTIATRWSMGLDGKRIDTPTVFTVYRNTNSDAGVITR